MIPWYSMMKIPFLSSIDTSGDGKPKHWSIEAWSWKPLSTWMYDRIRISRLLQFHLFNKFRLRHVRQCRRQQPRPHKQLLPESPVWEQRYVKTSTSNCGGRYIVIYSVCICFKKNVCRHFLFYAGTQRRRMRLDFLLWAPGSFSSKPSLSSSVILSLVSCSSSTWCNLRRCDAMCLLLALLAILWG